jgi:LysR family glycine cleavage system transcriptional activator
MLNQAAMDVMRAFPSATRLLAFEAAARTLSFVRVARELNVTPGAVSRQIQGLEEHLGATLFLRHHKRVELTPIGREYLAEIGPSLARIAAASARIQGASSRGALSIRSYPTFAIRWLLPRWGRFYDRSPEIDVRLTTSLTAVDFARDDYDLAIQVASEGRARPGLVQHKLVDVVVFPVCTWPAGCEPRATWRARRSCTALPGRSTGPAGSTPPAFMAWMRRGACASRA